MKSLLSCKLTFFSQGHHTKDEGTLTTADTFGWEDASSNLWPLSPGLWLHRGR